MLVFSTRVAVITHGIKSSLLKYPSEYVTSTNATPVNNQAYTTYGTNNGVYYSDDSIGDYFTFLDVVTADNNSFELQFSILSVLDS